MTSLGCIQYCRCWFAVFRKVSPRWSNGGKFRPCHELCTYLINGPHSQEPWKRQHKHWDAPDWD